jgi:hypothetical protein
MMIIIVEEASYKSDDAVLIIKGAIVQYGASCPTWAVWQRRPTAPLRHHNGSYSHTTFLFMHPLV